MCMFQTKGLIFRKTVVTRTGTVQHMSTCMVNPATSEYDYAEITIKGVFLYTVYIVIFKFKKLYLYTL